MSDELTFTQHYRIPKEEILTVDKILEKVYAALAEKGYREKCAHIFEVTGSAGKAWRADQRLTAKKMI